MQSRAAPSEAGLVQIRSLQIQIDEVPAIALLIMHSRPVSIGVAVAIRPGGLALHRVICGQTGGIAGEQRIDPRPHRRVQIVLGDARHDAMTFISPGMGRSWDEHRHERTARRNEQ